MANYDVASNSVAGTRITSKNQGVTGTGKVDGASQLNATLQGVKDIKTMRAQLQTFNGAYYTNARLEQMTDRDMVYALQLSYDPNSLK